MTTFVGMKWQYFLTLTLVVFCLGSCRVTRHVPENQSVVKKVDIKVDGVPSTTSDLLGAVFQKPYHRTFGFMPVSAWIYSWAGADSTSRMNRWLKKVGTAPPIYNEALTLRSERAMYRTVSAQGYVDATVRHEVKVKRKKAHVTYYIENHEPMYVDTIFVEVEDPQLVPFIRESESQSNLAVGMLLDHTKLEKERSRITQLLRNEGYWAFNKENVSFIADTVSHHNGVDLHVVVSGYHVPYRIGQVHFITNFNPMQIELDADSLAQTDSIGPGYLLTYSGSHCYLKNQTFIENCYVEPGTWYSESAVQNTYLALSRLHILKYANLRFEADSLQSGLLNCVVYTTSQNPNFIQLELDGTNSSGDFGFAAASTYQHRNIFRGSEAYTATLKGGYETLSGNVADLVNDNYVEFTFENTLSFPKFLFPFMSNVRRRRMRASTEVKASYSHQIRPEYTRIITNAGFSYNWLSRNRRLRHVFDVLDLSYVYLPKRSASFLEIIENAGPISYSSYQSHLIMAMAYNLNWSNVSISTGLLSSATANKNMRDVWSLRLSPEIAGNVLHAFSSLVNLKKEDGSYQLFDLTFEQYARFDMDFSYSKYLTDRSRLAMHLAGGVAVPYGNSSVMPFEKRYYSGGANSVRGWSVRTLGPGRYQSDGTRLDYFNQCGDVRLDASVELRSKLFWKFESAAFFDAGNVWTLKEYDSQPGGVISSTFYKQIAASWGIGLRLVYDYFVLRLDLGVKAFDPMAGSNGRWVWKNSLDGDNRTVHFAVGYPF